MATAGAGDVRPVERPVVRHVILRDDDVSIRNKYGATLGVPVTQVDVVTSWLYNSKPDETSELDAFEAPQKAGDDFAAAMLGVVDETLHRIDSARRLSGDVGCEDQPRRRPERTVGRRRLGGQPAGQRHSADQCRQHGRHDGGIKARSADVDGPNR